jgi:hypothetical protein
MADQPPPPQMPLGWPATAQAIAQMNAVAPPANVQPNPPIVGPVPPLPLGAPGLAAVAPMLAALPVARRPSTFLELYQDVQRDPCQGQYAAIMARFNPQVPEPVNSNTLFEQAIGTPAHVPQAYLCCVLTR